MSRGRIGLAEVGLHLMDREMVDHVEHSIVAAGIVSTAVGIAHNPEEYTDLEGETFQLMLAPEVDPKTAVKWLGKSVVSNYGFDFVLIDMFKASVSSHAHERVEEELERSHTAMRFNFAFILSGASLTPEQEEREESLRKRLYDMQVPVVELLPVPEPGEFDLILNDAERDAPAVDTLVYITDDFSIDRSLGYPLILTRTLAPTESPDSTT